MPRFIRLRLEKIQRDFLQGGEVFEWKPHLVKWAIFYLDKRKRGLGIKSLSTFNKALLSKQSWNFANEREAL